MNPWKAFVGVGVLSIAMTTLSLPAKQQAATNGAMPDFEGGWVRLDPSGGGSYGGVDAEIPRAVLTPQGQKMIAPPPVTAAQLTLGHGLDDNVAADTLQRKHNVGEPYIVTDGRCGGGGGGVGVDINSSAVFLLQTKNEVLVTREGPGARHIFVDGRSHPSDWTPTSGGHSVGRYENSQLVVDTTGFTAGPTGFGHGYKTPKTHLTERFRLSSDSQRLNITYTWTDPEVYEKPLVYDISFQRLPKGSYAMESWCDSSDPLERQSIVPPPQLP